MTPTPPTRSGRISAICATPPRPNPGMASVDLGLHFFAERSGFENIDRYQLILTEELHAKRSAELREEITSREQLPFEYHCMRGHLEELYESDVILFWGDFTHMSRHLNVTAKRLRRIGAAGDVEEGLAQCYANFFLSEAPDEVLNKVVVFGETILFNNLSSYADPTYARNFARFFSKARHVHLRDVYSAFNLCHLLTDYSDGHLGMDCSLLFRKENLEQLMEIREPGRKLRQPDRVGVFFGRSYCPPRWLGRFARDLCRAMGEEAEWISWWDSRSSHVMGKNIRSTFPALQGVDEQVGLPLDALARKILECKFIISDTYHLCMNAWKLGVPAICVGQGYAKQGRGRVNSGDVMAQRDKRHVFFSMYEALSYYVYVEELARRRTRKQRVEQLVTILSDDRFKSEVVRRIRAHSDHVEGMLRAEISEMLG